eukprot:TRINITY_DN4921_c0_g1_i1.p1 TRINITY_DN4921_c0_g1~~TRINITY_DN4921_c0_g1_i1.p1  ORF type:complete len:678 (+),score=159.55 TRINITY_DN4921_c0_g1_i1:2-2035(+)
MGNLVGMMRDMTQYCGIYGNWPPQVETTMTTKFDQTLLRQGVWLPSNAINIATAESEPRITWHLLATLGGVDVSKAESNLTHFERCVRIIAARHVNETSQLSRLVPNQPPILPKATLAFSKKVINLSKNPFEPRKSPRERLLYENDCVILDPRWKILLALESHLATYSRLQPKTASKGFAKVYSDIKLLEKKVGSYEFEVECADRFKTMSYAGWFAYHCTKFKGQCLALQGLSALLTADFSLAITCAQKSIHDDSRSFHGHMLRCLLAMFLRPIDDLVKCLQTLKQICTIPSSGGSSGPYSSFNAAWLLTNCLLPNSLLDVSYDSQAYALLRLPGQSRAKVNQTWSNFKSLTSQAAKGSIKDVEERLSHLILPIFMTQSLDLTLGLLRSLSQTRVKWFMMARLLATARAAELNQGEESIIPEPPSLVAELITRHCDVLIKSVPLPCFKSLVSTEDHSLLSGFEVTGLPDISFEYLFTQMTFCYCALSLNMDSFNQLSSWRRAKLKLIQGNPASALKDATACLKAGAKKKKINMTAETKAKMYSFRAVCAFMSGDLDAALKDLDLSLKYNPRDPETLEIRIKILLKSNKLHEAVHDMEKALLLLQERFRDLDDNKSGGSQDIRKSFADLELRLALVLLQGHSKGQYDNDVLQRVWCMLDAFGDITSFRIDYSKGNRRR